MKTLQTLALVAMVTFGFTACGGSTSTTEAGADTTAVEAPVDMLQDETDNAENTMQSDSTATDSTATGAGM